jgi:glycosyltransferase involved in cell wall biosynthesis
MIAISSDCPSLRSPHHPSGRSSLPRVLYIVNLNPSEKFGSLEEQIVFLSQAFQEQGSRLIPLFTYPGAPGSTDLLRTQGLETHHLDLSRFRLHTFLELWNLLARQQIAVIHWNMTQALLNPYLWLLMVVKPGVRHFYTDHNSRESFAPAPVTGWKKACKRQLLKCYRQVWCVSAFVRDCLVRQGTWSNLHCCRHFVNTDRFRPDPLTRARLRAEHGLGDRFVILVIAQLIPAKGVDLVLGAVAELPEQACLWIVGTGDQMAELQALARTLGIDHRVAFWGLQRQVEPFLQAADCFVLPSRWQEAAGLVILEAQSTGVPVVASRVGGIPEYVAEGRSAFLFERDDAHDLAAQLRKLCDDGAERARLGREGRALVLDRFSVLSQLPELLNRYRGP